MTMIERVARAIHDEKFRSPISGEVDMYRWESMSESYHNDSYEIARAAIEAMREPTREQIDAAVVEADDEYSFGGYEAKHCWQAMIDAALLPHHEGEGKP